MAFSRCNYILHCSHEWPALARHGRRTNVTVGVHEPPDFFQVKVSLGRKGYWEQFDPAPEFVVLFPRRLAAASLKRGYF